MSKLPKFDADPNVLVGLETADDAAVYRLTDDLAMIQTVDFFTPIVDDPYMFGQVAAANALSDVYAMGGIPKLALNIVGFPNCLSPDILSEIMKGGADKVKEAGSILIGGHSIQNDEPFYGLCVSGLVNPKKVQKNYGALPGDVLLLTKQIGTGIINTAAKASLADDKALKEATTVMSSLNRKAKEVMDHFTVHACTDITGFGLIGHGLEMAEASKVRFHLHSPKIPYIPESREYAEMGLIPQGAYENRKYQAEKVAFHAVDTAMQDILFDPQSSGGLLYSIPKEEKDAAMEALLKADLPTKVSCIGEVGEADEPSMKYIVVD